MTVLPHNIPEFIQANTTIKGLVCSIPVITAL